MMRAFLALDLPAAVLDAIADFQAALPTGRLVAPEALHLTLAFLDEQPAPVLAEVDVAMRGLRAAAFDLELAGVDTFGGRSPDLVFLGVAPNAALDHLHRKIMAALRGLGLELGRVRFRPHVTLARLPRRIAPRDLDRLAAFLATHAALHLPGLRVERFTLYRSTLRPEGPIHQALADYPLLPQPG